jgi:hypothetical protein
VRYLRFKADEASQTITGPYRQAHPDDNNERQAIHEHVSVPLAQLKKLASAGERERRSMTLGGAASLRRPAQKRSSTQSNGAMN